MGMRQSSIREIGVMDLGQGRRISIIKGSQEIGLWIMSIYSCLFVHRALVFWVFACIVLGLLRLVFVA